ncbi:MULTISPECIES: hypothetical protein [Methanosarcina]|uniref:hypothetical protein n=1 Tax=Methanosarcina TaxID=2207 RepID=UPI00064E7226|nr:MULTISPECIES: hypothetical protein [Methanosarcina]
MLKDIYSSHGIEKLSKVLPGRRFLEAETNCRQRIAIECLRIDFPAWILEKYFFITYGNN